MNDHDRNLFTKLYISVEHVSNLIVSAPHLLALTECHFNQVDLLLDLVLSLLECIEFAVDLSDANAKFLHIGSRLLQVLLILLAALDGCVENEDK